MLAGGASQDQLVAPLLQEESKGCWALMQATEVLGLVVDLAKGEFRILEKKLEDIEWLCQLKD